MELGLKRFIRNGAPRGACLREKFLGRTHKVDRFVLKLLSLKYIFYNRESQSEVQTDFCELQSVRETRVVRSKTDRKSVV